MTTIDILNAVYKHQIQGVMFHEQVAMLYDFMGLQGYKRCHEYHTMSEFANARSIQRYAVNHTNHMITEEHIDSARIIPANWKAATRFDVGENDRKGMVKKLFEYWKSWETDTKKFYQDTFKQLMSIDEVACANKINMLIKDVDCELKKLEREYILLMSVGFDMVYIVERQHELHEKYAKKTKELGVEFN